MVKKMVEKAVELTKECWTRYWQLDLDFMLEHCAEDVTWVGAVQSQFMQGKDNVREDFERMKKELKPCHLLGQEFIAMNNSGSTCTVIGRYLVTTDDDVEYFLQAQQRCTFVWVKTEETLEIKHIHVSNPIGEMKIAENEIFVNKMGKMAGEYMRRQIDTLTDTTRIVGTSPDGHSHFIKRSEIICASALNKYCEIHTFSGDISLKMQISEFLKIAGSGFAAVHRSYVVNRDLIREIRPYDVVMVDGTAVPIPMRKYSQIRDQLINDHIR